MTRHLDAMTGFARRGLLSPTAKVEVEENGMRIWRDQKRSDAVFIHSVGVFATLHKIKIAQGAGASTTAPCLPVATRPGSLSGAPGRSFPQGEPDYEGNGE